MRERLFESERSILVLRPADGPQDADALDETVFEMWGDITDAELEAFLADIEPDYYYIKRSRSVTQWGGQGSSTEVILQWAATASDTIFRTRFNDAIDKFFDRRKQPGPTPGADRAVASARTRIATRFPTRGDDLTLVSEYEDAIERTQKFVFQDTEYVYNAVVRTTAKGHVYVTGVGRTLRHPNAVG